MVSLKSDAFRKKAEKLIEKLRAEDGFYLVHMEDSRGEATLFGNRYICFLLPLTVGEEEKADTGRSVWKLMSEKFWSDEAQKNMKWVPLPKASELKPGRDMEHPTKCPLAATDMPVLNDGRILSIAGECAMYPFAVQARYLKMALQLATFGGQKDVRSVYNPLCLWFDDGEGNQALGVIMPMRE